MHWRIANYIRSLFNRGRGRIVILYYVMLIIMTMLGAIASLFLKRASSFLNLLTLIKNHNLYCGAFLYFLSAILNIYVLRYLEYSVVLPLTSLTYVWTMFLSYLFLKEKIGVKKCVGVSLIFAGAIVVSMF